MDFEELALKGIDPTLGPTVLNPDSSSYGDKTLQGESVPRVGISSLHIVSKPRFIIWIIQISLIYPPSITHLLPLPLLSSPSHHPSLSHLQSFLSDRKPRHRKGFYTWM